MSLPALTMREQHFITSQAVALVPAYLLHANMFFQKSSGMCVRADLQALCV
jgi:hypothetical protein